MKKIIYTFNIDNGYGSDYRHPTWRFYELSISNYRSQRFQHSEGLFEIVCQTDKGNGHSIFRAYALRGQEVNLYNPLAIKTLSAISKDIPTIFRLSPKSLQRNIKRMKAERVVYNNDHRLFIPYKHRKNADLWVQAFQKGLTLTKA